MISRNSAFVYKGKPINAQSVANELGVQYVVEGSVRRAASRVRAIGALGSLSLARDTGSHKYWAKSHSRSSLDR